MMLRTSARLARLGLLGGLLLAAACGGKTPPPRAAPPPAPRPDTPEGPTRTDFKTISKKLVSRCVAGGWIHRWRASTGNTDVAKPRIHLRDFEDKTGQELDATYLNSVLERRMQLSGVYEMVAADASPDFVARGKLLRMAESKGKRRVTVYTALLEIVSTDGRKTAYSCEATVEGEM